MEHLKRYNTINNHVRKVIHGDIRKNTLQDILFTDTFKSGNNAIRFKICQPKTNSGA